MIIVAVIYTILIYGIGTATGIMFEHRMKIDYYCIKCGREDNPLSMRMKCMSGKVVSCCNICYALYMAEIQKYRVEN